MKLNALRKSPLKAAALFLFLCGCIAALYFIRQMSEINGYAAEAKRLAAHWCLTKEEVYERFAEVEAQGLSLSAHIPEGAAELIHEIADAGGYERLVAIQQNPHVTISFKYSSKRGLRFVRVMYEGDNGFELYFYENCKLREMTYTPVQ